MEPFRSFVDLIGTIPGIGDRTAEVIVAETGADMSVFPTAAHLVSWAGTCPGRNESAGRVKSTATRPGNPYLKSALGAAALSIANTHGTYLSAKYRRIAARRGPKKALVAVEHAILTAVWNMAHTGALYDDPGPDYYTSIDPERSRRRALNQLRQLGYNVTLTPIAASAQRRAGCNKGNLRVRSVERVTGIEPAWPAWKAAILIRVAARSGGGVCP